MMTVVGESLNFINSNDIAKSEESEEEGGVERIITNWFHFFISS